jgi:GntR family transcriptional repressor for pyruvate dehydrogenase complex
VVSAADRAASGIRALIVAGEYVPGDRLPSERELSLELELSRPALREGIRRLRSGGVLESRRGSGTYVADVDLDGVYDIRTLLEPFAAHQAALRRTDDQLAEMRATLERMDATAPEDGTGFDLADARFHALVATASGSTVLADILGRLGELALLTRTVISSSSALRQDSYADIERVCVAIERQHPRRAANAMERHIRHVRHLYATAREDMTASRPRSRRGRRL